MLVVLNLLQQLVLLGAHLHPGWPVTKHFAYNMCLDTMRLNVKVQDMMII